MLQHKSNMRTELIDEAERLYDYACANRLESFLESGDPLRENHLDTLRAMTTEERTEYHRRLAKKTEESLQYIRDNMIFVVPKGFWKKD